MVHRVPCPTASPTSGGGERHSRGNNSDRDVRKGRNEDVIFRQGQNDRMYKGPESECLRNF